MPNTQLRHINTVHNEDAIMPLLVSQPMQVTGMRRPTFNICHINVVPEGSGGRQVFQGPIVPGPWPFSTTHAIGVDNSGKFARDAADAESRSIPLGEHFTIEGMTGVWAFRDPKVMEGDGPVLFEVTD